MQSIAYIPGSNGAGNASQMTVQNVRSPGASDIIVNTVTSVPTKFYGSMGAPHTFTDPVTGETITIISEATAVDFAGHVDTGKIVIDAIAPGYVDTRGSLVGDIVVVRPVTEWANNIFNILNQSLNDNGSIKDSAITYNPNIPSYISSGGIWTILSGLNGSMTALVGWQGGLKGTVAAVATRAFTVSKDTYVDVLRTTTGYTTTFSLVYTEVAVGAAAPALAANSIRIAIVTTSGAAITSIKQYDRMFGNYIDSLGNVIYPFSNSISTTRFQVSDVNQTGGHGNFNMAGMALTINLLKPATVIQQVQVRADYQIGAGTAAITPDCDGVFPNAPSMVQRAFTVTSTSNPNQTITAEWRWTLPAGVHTFRVFESSSGPIYVIGTDTWANYTVLY